MKKYLKLPPLELLNHLFYVDHSSPSGLRWKNPRSPAVKENSYVGSLHQSGHWDVSIKTDKKRVYKVHRIIYFMETGVDPYGYEIDHINGNRGENSEIRIATCKQNATNRKKHSSWRGRNKISSQYKGVVWSKAAGKWCSVICINGVQKHLGVFTDEAEAARVYNAAAFAAWAEFAKLNDIK
jgi:hypothetical protein